MNALNEVCMYLLQHVGPNAIHNAGSHSFLAATRSLRAQVGFRGSPNHYRINMMTEIGTFS